MLGVRIDHIDEELVELLVLDYAVFHDVIDQSLEDSLVGVLTSVHIDVP